MSIARASERSATTRTLVLQSMDAGFEEQLAKSKVLGGRPFEHFEDLYVLDLAEGEVEEVAKYLRDGGLPGLYMAQFEAVPYQEPVVIRGPQYSVIENMRKDAPSVKVKLGVLPRELARVKDRPMRRRFDY